MSATGTTRAAGTELRCECGRRLRRHWLHCPHCRRRLTWGGAGPGPGECRRCRWVIAPTFAFCPWCGARADAGPTAAPSTQLPHGFQADAECDWACGSGVQYPMPFCPACGREQEWPDDDFEGVCPRCNRGVDDWMDWCPWCGGDATGRDLIPRTVTRVQRLLLVARVPEWGYRILLRPGISGVDPQYPKIVEIERDYVTGRKRRADVPWTMLVGLVCHEIGHSFLYHHWAWTRTDEFRRVFGSVDEPYRVGDDTWVDMQRASVTVAPTSYVTAYASTHPQEDFAETFRFYVTRRGRLKQLFHELGKKRKEVVVYEKFLALHHFVRWLRGGRDGVV